MDIRENTSSKHAIVVSRSMIQRIDGKNAIWRIKMLDGSSISIISSYDKKEKRDGSPLTEAELKMIKEYRASK